MGYHHLAGTAGCPVPATASGPSARCSVLALALSALNMLNGASFGCRGRFTQLEGSFCPAAHFFYLPCRRAHQPEAPSTRQGAGQSGSARRLPHPFLGGSSRRQARGRGKQARISCKGVPQSAGVGLHSRCQARSGGIPPPPSCRLPAGPQPNGQSPSPVRLQTVAHVLQQPQAVGAEALLVLLIGQSCCGSGWWPR